jgi:ATP-dependent Lon protease
MRDYEFFVDFVTFAKGLDTQVIQGPSAGAAIALAQYSAGSGEQVLPNIVITGGITPKGELVQVGGLDFRGMGKFIVALNTDGVDTMVIPASNYERLTRDDIDFFQRRGLSILSAGNFWEIAKIALASHPDREEAVRKLKSKAGSRRTPSVP